ncbi:putative jouberin-like [Trypanosoma conorhini]|uniref:Putative jouberin-like n=1 Tax=Trypanosoma conorhini TaxID=83891 RepID=A0A422P5L9_9TRYP|nr:putative jouberin-like [Trypanosoma conorhini]RNF13017.1 putative jouberin-like [Trypanosoma conorhini]
MMRDDASSDPGSNALVEARRLPLPLPPPEGHTTALFVPEEAPTPAIGTAFPTSVPSLRDSEKQKTPLSFSGASSITVAGTDTAWGRQEVATLRGGRESLQLVPPGVGPTAGTDDACDAAVPPKVHSSRLEGDGLATRSAVAPQGHASAPNPLIGASHPWGSCSQLGEARTGATPRTQLPELIPYVPDNAQEAPLVCRAETTAGTAWLSLTILGMSPLHPNTSIVHPFVRIWLVNGVTGKNLIETGCGVAPFVMTHPVDLRLRGTRAPWWGAEFTLRVDSRVVRDVSCNAVLLLEVLEVGTETIHGFPLQRDGLYPICWGFLKLHDVHGRLNARDRLQLQMFPFPQRASFFTKLRQMLPSFCFPISSAFATEDVWTEAENAPPSGANSFQAVSDAANDFSFVNVSPPEIFFVYRNSCNRKVPYSAGMLISLKEVKKDGHHPRETPIFPYEEYLMAQMSVPEEFRPNSLVSVSLSRPRMRRARGASPSLINATALSKCYLRENDERVVPPTALLQRVQIRGRVSCVAFAGGSAVLAMGVSVGLEHLVQLRHLFMPELPVVGVFRGHVGHIHHVAFSDDSKLLLSCSSDKTVRVWRCDVPFCHVETSTEGLSNCLGTLPHSFPVYNGIFYRRHIITCGYDPRMFVWAYANDLSERSAELALDAASRQTLRETRGTRRGSSMSGTASASFSDTDPACGQLVHVTSGEDGAIIRSVCAAQRNRVWSVDALGNVLVWRVSDEDTNDAQRVWQMSVRHRLKCKGAISVEAHGGRVLVKCASVPVAYLFNASNYQLMHEVALHQRPYVPALTLLPDGEAVVAATSDGKLLSWECVSGTLCTARDGYGRVQVNFSIGAIVWSGDQQLCVILGTEAGVGYVSNDTDARMTCVAVVGTPRTAESVILRGDARAPDYFRARFGGELTARQRSRRLTRDDSAAAAATTSGNGRFSHVSLAPDENMSGDKGSRMGQIIALWKGLVGQHRHLKRRDVGEAQSHPAEVYIVDDR